MVFSCFLSFVRPRIVDGFGRGVGRGCFNGGSADGGDGFSDLPISSFLFFFFSWNFDLFVVLGCGMSCSCLWDYGVETWLWVIGRFELGRERIALFHVTKHSSFAACLWLVGNGFWIENLSYGFGDRPAHSCFRT